MKKQKTYRQMLACLAAALTLLGTASAVRAAAPALQGSLTLRPLTPTEIKTYGLTGSNAQFSAGCKNVALGEPVYLDAMVNAAIAPSNIVGVVWTLTNLPAGSQSAFTTSPLNNGVPLYNTSDRYTGENSTPAYQLADRHYFRPDVMGSYTVKATITTVGSGSTNLVVTITAGTYVGIATCAGCHSGGVVFNGKPVPNVYPTFTNTGHASMFSRGIDGLVSNHYGKSCISCHTLGFDTNAIANNLGFDDLALIYNWTFPSVLTNGNWASMQANYPAVAALANIQCENCHGPGNQHIYSQNVVGNTNAISVNYAAGDCSQCHDSLTGHSKSAEWNNSLHASVSRTPSGITRPHCVRCHTAPGFAGWATAGGMAMQNLHTTNVIWANSSSTNFVTYINNTNYPTYTVEGNPPNTTYYPITCQACHDPHNASNPNQLRMGYDVTLSDGTVVTNAGAGGFCMECHNSRNGSVTNMMAKYPLNQPNWAGGVGFGPHDSPQADMLEGVNAITYGQTIPSAPHANVVADTCAGCHMQPVAATVVVNGVTNANPAFTHAGGHTFKMDYNVTNNGVVTEVPLTDVCVQCHGTLDDFDVLSPDYVGVGYGQGIQTQVQQLLNKLSTLYPPTNYWADPNKYAADGKVKTSLSTYTNMPAKFLNAAYNFQFVKADGSMGVHNGPFAVGLLKASIGNLTGDANGDGLPDSWQNTYFGANYATNPAAGINGVNNTNGLPNWMMYAMGLSPFSGSPALNGVIYVNGKNIVNGATNTVAIYTAAEIAFDTQPGTTYAVQGISALTGNWFNISTNIPGTGGSVSYITPTRNNAQMFYRVVHTP
jgi:hypothetical protein